MYLAKEEERSAKKQKVVHSESNSNGNHESTVGSDDEMVCWTFSMSCFTF